MQKANKRMALKPWKTNPTCTCGFKMALDAGFPTTHLLHHEKCPMRKEQDEKREILEEQRWGEANQVMKDDYGDQTEEHDNDARGT